MGPILGSVDIARILEASRIFSLLDTCDAELFHQELKESSLLSALNELGDSGQDLSFQNFVFASARWGCTH